MTAGSLITSEHQVEWRGVLFGPSGSARLGSVSGHLDVPAMLGANSERPGRHGASPGRKRLGERVIEASVHAPAGASSTVVAAVRAATTVAEDPVEEDLVIWSGTSAPVLVRGRLERRAVPCDPDAGYPYWRAVLQWVCCDPRLYSLSEHSTSVGLPAPPATGLGFPLVFPLDFGTGSAASQVSATNAGGVSTWPVIEIDGPVTGPIVTCVATGQRLVFDPSWSIPAGVTVSVDTDARSVAIGSVSYRSRLFTAQWFPLPPGTTVINFSSVGSYDAAAAMTVRWRDADI